ncbi:hypothetical protein HGO37_00295 [Rhizobium sp. CG4]|jgi:hypothetical protein|uniref:hypothetical protein n=1 Tax=Rhizobium/Agrobacterium group TaxID=227290 RepID=UPI000FA8CDC8|nr:MULTISPECIES: hypothetical protein [Rhizobium/Agrobacterium group]MBD9387813.1 hypothetical protein [Agrobacterium sp. AGB01]MCM2453815.1 hypothetical protein [Rhizobium sp. CG4]MCS4242262.1 hypothetical protein [Rhizobium sp. BIGb0125]MDO5895999.1 hypothetical protein [Agrobacterium sp. Azo12]
MTQVLSISANTAAYAMEALKPAQREPKKTVVEEAIHALARRVEQGSDQQLRALINVVKPPSLALYFLTSSHHQNPQATYEQVQEAYEDNESKHEAA